MSAQIIPLFPDLDTFCPRAPAHNADDEIAMRADRGMIEVAQAWLQTEMQVMGHFRQPMRAADRVPLMNFLEKIKRAGPAHE